MILADGISNVGFYLIKGPFVSFNCELPSVLPKIVCLFLEIVHLIIQSILLLFPNGGR